MAASRLHIATTLAFMLLASACKSSGAFTWYSELPSSERVSSVDGYVLGVGDTVNIRVYDQENLSVHGKIRRDGRISMPFAGEIVAVGKQPAALAHELESKLKEFIVTPRVTVNVEESQPVSVSVLGEVGTRGTLTLAPPATLVQALAQAGGPTEFADEDSIFVLRTTPSVRRIRFTYEAILKDVGGAASFPLHGGDVIVVE